jgi:hypothetical protein
MASLARLAALPAYAQPGDEPRDDAPPAPTSPAPPSGVPGPAATPEAAQRGGARPFWLGLTQGFGVGFGGSLSNPAPSYLISLDLGFATGRSARYHVELGLQTLNGSTGVRFAPLTLGYELWLAELGDDRRVGVELALSLVSAEALFGDRYAIALSSGVRATALLSWGPAFAGLTVLGAEVRYAYGLEDVGIQTGIGANWPFRLTLGVEL